MRNQIMYAILVGSVIAIIAPSEAIANNGPGPYLWATQRGDGVELFIYLRECDQLSIDQAYTLRRNGEVLFEDKILSAVDADSVTSRCRSHDSCEPDSIECVDCDGDGWPECEGGWSKCTEVYEFVYLDSCVRGRLRYQIDPAPVDGGSCQLTVKNVGLDCEAQDHNLGCAVINPGLGSFEVLLTGLLLGLGLIALGFSIRHG
ncbi:MAG: hypothetical protein QNJ97_18080 [Myxococcota bacterium]|nr:hypothetical protein [Myxococcota bacterium]